MWRKRTMRPEKNKFPSSPSWHSAGVGVLFSSPFHTHSQRGRIWKGEEKSISLLYCTVSWLLMYHRGFCSWLQLITRIWLWSLNKKSSFHLDKLFLGCTIGPKLKLESLYCSEVEKLVFLRKFHIFKTVKSSLMARWGTFGTSEIIYLYKNLFFCLMVIVKFLSSRFT